jgi:hypothetical protein
MSDQQTKRVTIPLRNVRLGFPSLFRARKDEKNPEKTPKFEATFILDAREHAAVVKQIEEAQRKLAAGQGWKPSMVKSVALRNGEEKVDGEGNCYSGFGPGTLFITARTKNRPQLVKTDRSAIVEDDNLIYPGLRRRQAGERSANLRHVRRGHVREARRAVRRRGRERR